MTDEEIQAAYDETVTPPYEHACWLAFARRIAEIEREECANVCEGDLSMVAWQCAEKIRARDEKCRGQMHLETQAATRLQEESFGNLQPPSNANLSP